MVDPGRLRFLLDRIGAELRHLDRLAALGDAALTADPDRMAAVKYRFIVAIEAAIDCCHHVIASEGLRYGGGLRGVVGVPADLRRPRQGTRREGRPKVAALQATVVHLVGLTGPTIPRLKVALSARTGAAWASRMPLPQVAHDVRAEIQQAVAQNR